MESRHLLVDLRDPLAQLAVLDGPARRTSPYPAFSLCHPRRAAPAAIRSCPAPWRRPVLSPLLFLFSFSLSFFSSFPLSLSLPSSSFPSFFSSLFFFTYLSFTFFSLIASQSTSARSSRSYCLARRRASRTCGAISSTFTAQLMTSLSPSVSSLHIPPYLPFLALSFLITPNCRRLSFFLSISFSFSSSPCICKKLLDYRYLLGYLAHGGSLEG